MNKNTIRIGTRGSKLALYQAEKVKDTLQNYRPDLTVEIIVIKTKGDKILDTALSKIGDKGLFTKEIEVALIENRADIAVHSLKDLSTELPKELQLTAVLERGEVRDALIHKTHKRFDTLTSSDVIATSSLRRVASLKKSNPDIRITDIRGNVNTRIEKMLNGHCDGLIMAAAGLLRLGLDKYITEVIDPLHFIPAVAQGAIAIQSRINDEWTNTVLAGINDSTTLQAVIGERKFLNTLQGGCQVPVGCYSEINNTEITFTGFVSDLEGKVYLKERISGELRNSESLGKSLAEQLANMGGQKILEQIRNVH